MNYQEAYNFIFNEIGDEGITLLLLLAEDKTLEGIKLIQQLTSCNDDTAKMIWVDLKCEYGTSETNPFIETNETLSPAEIAYNNQLAQEWQNKPTCPTCGSKNLKKVSATSKIVNTAVFGIFGTKRHKTFHCNNCGYEW